jgi:hypothetical protein
VRCIYFTAVRLYPLKKPDTVQIPKPIPRINPSLRRIAIIGRGECSGRLQNINARIAIIRANPTTITAEVAIPIPRMYTRPRA